MNVPDKLVLFLAGFSSHACGLGQEPTLESKFLTGALHR